MKKIGVLLPQSKAYPAIGKEFMNGLRLSLETGGEFEFKIEGIGLGSDPKSMIDSIQKLVNQEGVRLTTGLLGHHDLSEVLEFVEGMEEVLIYSDLGAKKPISLKNRSGIYCNSLDLFESVERLGNYFVENGTGEIAISTCYYDSGYGFIQALEYGLAKGDSSEIAGHFITPHQPRENESELMKEFVEYCKPNAIFGFHNGIFAKEHAEFLKENKIYEDIPLFTTPFSVGKPVLKDFQEVFEGTKCVSTWFPEIENQANSEFVKRYENEYGKTPSFFSLLGYENGLLILQKLSGENAIHEPVEGPRGEMRVDPTSNRTHYAHYLWQITSGQQYSKVADLGKAALISAEAEVENSEEGGWYNAYLCH